MATLQFNFDIEDLEQLQAEEISLDAFLDEIVLHTGYEEFDDGNYGEVVSVLFSYHDKQGGAPDIDDLSINDSSFDFETLKGQMVICYWVSFSYTCSDMNTQSDHYETWNFRIDLEQRHLIINIPEYERLNPSEEL